MMYILAFLFHCIFLTISNSQYSGLCKHAYNCFLSIFISPPQKEPQKASKGLFSKKSKFRMRQADIQSRMHL